MTISIPIPINSCLSSMVSTLSVGLLNIREILYVFANNGANPNVMEYDRSHSLMLQTELHVVRSFK